MYADLFIYFIFENKLVTVFVCGPNHYKPEMSVSVRPQKQVFHHILALSKVYQDEESTATASDAAGEIGTNVRIVFYILM